MQPVGFLLFFAAAFARVCGFAVPEVAVLGFPVLGFAVLGFVLFVAFELAAEEDCPSTERGEAQAHVRTRAQPVPNHLRIFARCFRFMWM